MMKSCGAGIVFMHWKALAQFFIDKKYTMLSQIDEIFTVNVCLESFRYEKNIEIREISLSSIENCLSTLRAGYSIRLGWPN